ncbi:MAG TPA: acyl-ACP--UDP-N-acetylglucosamine O-acyltransferase [Bacteroidales bacterium]|nr:acyl-ACP--UDP-N-acetylglucosamine O-acyltransferase [Bacteroidales bacterium]
MISNLAYVHPEAKIGEGVTIEPFSTVYKDVVIGDGTWVGPNAVIMDGARIGKKCRIFPGAIIAGIPQDLKFAGEYTTAEIGDNTTIRECVTFNRGTKAKEKTVIGSNCLVMAYVHIGHDCIIGNNVILVNAVSIAGEVEIGDWAIIGGGTLVHQFSKIGEHVMVSGGSLIRKDVPPFVKAGREPLSYAGINSVGLRRRGFTNEAIYAIQEMYRHIYQSDMNVSNALNFIESNMPHTPERDTVVNFVRGSKRGVMKGFTSDIED